MYKKTGTNSPDIMLFIKNLIILENSGDFFWGCIHFAPRFTKGLFLRIRTFR
ncbi:hypothetical protein HMPREF9129_2209 [Peptoniphilus indolicus ATCC 29427]|uniref:Uncharacterized protein n=1 Tax=Peptoniphilus indolicus ATCC 29427 TaxID=997350 RepID=G4D729_9FIRM|nr:hypothetical protein HMPREF9129_2209 [Peptoniphilus indolicus ATCC 29427]